MLSTADFAQGGYRYEELKQRGIVSSRSDLSNKQRKFGFPKPIKLADRTAWFAAVEVHAWLAKRAALRDAGRKIDLCPSHGGRCSACEGHEQHREKDEEMQVKAYMGPFFIKYADVVDKPRREKITGAREGDYGKLVLDFESGASLSLNQTNLKVMAKTYSTESEEWIGKIVELYAGETTFNEQSQKSVLIRPISPPTANLIEEEAPL